MESHAFTKLKTADREPFKTVNLRGVNFKVYKDGSVYHWTMCGKRHKLDEIHFMSPLAAEVRKTSGWFE